MKVKYRKLCRAHECPVHCLQARTEYLRRKARAALQPTGGSRDDGDEEQGGGSGALEHLNLFPLEESSEKKGNEEYLREKKEEKVSVLLLLSVFSFTLFFCSDVAAE